MARKWVRIPVLVAAAATGVLGLSIVLLRQSVEPASRVTVCSFNVQFLGHFTAKENASLSESLKSFDAVVVQELVSRFAPWSSLMARR